jgi:hypothetical protein
MSLCDKCRANKICDHNRFGFENCNNFIPPEIDVIRDFANELWSSLQYMPEQDLDLGWEIEHLVKEREKKYANM